MLQVSAAIIRNAKGQILVCRRGPGGNCAYLWEFPGGKQEPSESPEECLMRECQEELGIALVAAAVCMACAALIGKAAKKKLDKKVLAVVGAAAFVGAILAIILIARTPMPL